MMRKVCCHVIYINKYAFDYIYIFVFIIFSPASPAKSPIFVKISLFEQELILCIFSSFS